MTYAADVLALSPLAYYRLNEVSSLVDSGGSARHGTFTGGTATVVAGLVVGDADQAVNFASSARGQVTSAAWMNATSFTILATIKPTAVAATNQGIVERYNGAASGSYTASSFTFRLSTNKLQAGIFSGASTLTNITGTTVLVAGSTYDVAMTYNGTTGLISTYINGLPEASGTRLAMNTSTLPLTIGYNGVSNPYTGPIDEVVYIGSELTAAQIGTMSWSRRGSLAFEARVHAETIEVLGTGVPSGRVHNVTAEVLAKQPDPTGRIHGVTVEVLAPVDTPPGPPANVAVNPCGLGPLLTWDPPTSGGPADEYEIRANGIPGYYPTTETHYAFYNIAWNLVSGFSYTFEVRAFGNGGYSAWVAVTGRAPFIWKELFPADGNWTAPAHINNATVLLVGGGGGGGNHANGAGGGGAGGVALHFNIGISPGQVVPVVVGTGGATQATLNVPGNNGTGSSFGPYTVLGGGGGLAVNTDVQTGFASGGGGGPSGVDNDYSLGGVGTPPQGYNGGGGRGAASAVTRAGGGGGGAGGNGGQAYFASSVAVGGRGGPGFDGSRLFGTTVGESGWFASGGAGGTRNHLGTNGVSPLGGGGGGGAGATGGLAGAGQVNTGGGGGGGGGNSNGAQTAGAAGASGYVIVCWYRIGISYGAADTFTVPAGLTSADVLVVGGGGSGGAWSGTGGNASGGGGAGGVLWTPAYALSPGTVPVTVGAAGVAPPAGVASLPGGTGGSSSFGPLTRLGGGGGGTNGTALAGTSGSSGGGGGIWGISSVPLPGGAGTPGQGFAGGDGNGSVTTPSRRGGGGGGATAAGANAATGTPLLCTGGTGLNLYAEVGYAIGDSGWFGGGGAGGQGTGGTATPPIPAPGGGGQGANWTGKTMSGGLPYSGGGGGGAGGAGTVEQQSPNGGQGVVSILWDPPPPEAAHGNAVIDMQTGYMVMVWDPATLSWKPVTEEIGL